MSLLLAHLERPLSLSLKPLCLRQNVHVAFLETVLSNIFWSIFGAICPLWILGQNVQVAFLEMFLIHSSYISYGSGQVHQISHSYAKRIIYRSEELLPWPSGWELLRKGRYNSSSQPDQKTWFSKIIYSFTWPGKASFPKFRTRSFILNLHLKIIIISLETFWNQLFS